MVPTKSWKRVAVLPGFQVKVTLVPDALPDVKLTGVIQTISSAFTKQGGDIVYSVRILVDNPLDPRIRWGMTVEATFASLPK